LKFSKERITQISKGNPEDIALFITSLLETIERLENRVQELERQLNQNSKNSSKPPSSDGFRKPTNLRVPGGKNGAPKGHDGHTLRFVEQPDEVIIHPLPWCLHCSASLNEVTHSGYEKRQVFDLPVPRLLVTEHRAEKKCCPFCNHTQQAAFPVQVNAPVQYGEGFASWTVYLNMYQMLPLERTQQFFADLTGQRPSEATLLSHMEGMHQALEPHERTIREHLLRTEVAHADETTVRIEGKKQWLHNMSDARWTHMAVHKSRGSQAMDDIGILPAYTGILVHDCNMPYFKDKYTFGHALCCAHLMRECQGITDYDHHRWSTQMKQLLQESWRLARAAKQENRELDENKLLALERRYDEILRQGEAEWRKGKQREKTGPRGRKSKSKAANLGERFHLHKHAILRFLRDARVPFDNNQAERDIRMVKVKEKVSGTFRTWRGAEQFARARGFISTARKQDLCILSSLTSVLLGNFRFSCDT
jgi:transposase